LRKCAKSRESMRKCAKTWESMLKVQKVCQNLRKYEKVCKKLRKLEKVSEYVVNANGNANCYLFAVQMLIFFWCAVQKSDAFCLGGGEGGVCVKVSPRTACCCQKDCM